MQGCFPFRMCLECIQGPSFSATQSYAHLRDEVHCVKLDASHMGSEVILLKNGTRICGTGGALATAPIVQNKAFFQVNVQQSGVWGVGLANRSTNLSSVPIVANAWLLRNDGNLVADGEVVAKLQDEPQLQEGDTIGIAYDHVELKFFRADEPLPVSIRNIKPGDGNGQQHQHQPLYSIVYVDDNAILDVKFRSFDMNLPAGYEEIMIEQTLL